MPRTLDEAARRIVALERALEALLVQPGRFTLLRGDGSPEGVVTAPVGTLYLRDDGGAGTSMYVKESGAGNTGWVAK